MHTLPPAIRPRHVPCGLLNPAGRGNTIGPPSARSVVTSPPRPRSGEPRILSARTFSTSSERPDEPGELPSLAVPAARAFSIRCWFIPEWLGLLALIEDFVANWDDPRLSPRRRSRLRARRLALHGSRVHLARESRGAPRQVQIKVRVGEALVEKALRLPVITSRVSTAISGRAGRGASWNRLAARPGGDRRAFQG